MFASRVPGGCTYNFTQVLSLGMADGDGGVLPLEQLGGGGAHDPAAAEDHGGLAGDGHAGAPDQL